MSACLLGDAVRYDGGHKRDLFLTEALAPWVRWERVCPEVEIGMGVPRPPIRLEEADGGIRLVEPAARRDHTEKMREWAQLRIKELAGAGLDGYVLKSASPSCGLGSVKVHRDGQALHARGNGVFAAELRKRWPGLPVVEESGLAGRRTREDFAERAFARNRWRVLAEREAEPRDRRAGHARRRSRPDPAGLVAYHEAHELLFWARDEQATRRMNRLVGQKGRSRSLLARYEAGLSTVLATPARRGGHVDVLRHARDCLEQVLGPEEARRIEVAIEEYRLASAPRTRALELLRRSALRHDCRRLLGQLYFDPLPMALLGDGHEPGPIPVPQHFRDRFVT